jgi:hypothetical protein
MDGSGWGIFLGAHNIFGPINRPQTRGGCALLAGLAAGFFVFSDLQNAGPRTAAAFELQLQTETKQDTSSEKTSFKGQVHDSVGWLSVKLEGGVWNIDRSGLGALASPDSMTSGSFSLGLNEVPIVKSTLADTRVTLGMWDDWVRWTSRQAVSNYITPGTDAGYLVRPGFGLDDAATSQHIDAGIWKTGSMRLSVFAEYDRVGAYFEAPHIAIKPDDPFSTPNSTTTRLGSSIEWGPVTFTLEQRAQQSLAQYNAPITTENQIGVWLNLDDLRGRSEWTPQNASWLMPSSMYLNVGQGRVRATLDQGVNGDTASDVSAGFAWKRGNTYANLGYWTSNYQSQLYPWKGYGLDGSIGFYEGQWNVGLYFDVYRSSYAYPQQWVDVIVGQQLINQNYNDISGGFYLTGHF